MAATSLMSLSPLRPASDEVNVKAFFSFEASTLGAVDAARTPLIAAPPTDTVVGAETNGFVIAPDVAAVDVDDTDIKEVGPAEVAAAAGATVPVGGRVMVKDKGGAASVATEGSVLMAGAVVIVVEAPAATEVAVTLGAC